MNEFHDNRNLNDVVVSLLNELDSLKHFKLLWSALNNNSSGSKHIYEHTYEPYNSPIINIICHKNRHINDYLFNKFKSFYIQSITQYLTACSNATDMSFIRLLTSIASKSNQHLTRFITNILQLPPTCIMNILSLGNTKDTNRDNFGTQLLHLVNAEKPQQMILKTSFLSDKQKMKIFGNDTLFQILSINENLDEYDQYGNVIGSTSRIFSGVTEDSVCSNPFIIDFLIKYFQNDATLSQLLCFTALQNGRNLSVLSNPHFCCSFNMDS